MTEYKVILAEHKEVEKLDRPKKHYGGGAGLYEPQNFQNQVNGMVRDGWAVSFSNVTSYGSEGVILYALMKKN